MTVGQLLEASTARGPNAIAIVEGDIRLTYAEWSAEIRCLAGGLSELGLSSGDHIVAILSNRLEMANLYWASQMLGLIFTPFNWRASGEEIAYIVEDAEAKVIIYETRSAEAVLAAVTITDFPIDRLIRVDYDGLGINFSKLSSAPPYDEPEPNNDDAICLMLYTSGTTGRPKGVPRSHSVEQMASLGCLAQLHYRYGEISLGVMPLFHTMGVRSLLMSVLLNGTFVCMPVFDSGTALKVIEKEKVSSLFLVPTMFHDIVNSSDLKGCDLSTITNIAYAGMSMTTALVRKCSKIFPKASFSNFYGSSEIYTFAVRNNLMSNPRSAGRAGFGQTLRVVRADADERVKPDEIMSVGETGEIIANMNALDAFSGYWKRPDADEKAIRDGWYFTGDLGCFDENGEIYVLGRVDDMIISGGENIYAEEVEDALAKSPDVLGVAVIGIPDDRWGEKITAFIEPSNPVTSASGLDAFCLQSGLARFKRPRAYAFVKAIPRSASGKLLRRHLRLGNYVLLGDYEHTI